MDYDIREEALHLIAMADQPAFRAQAALRLKELMASHEMFLGLPELIREERERNASQSPSL